VAIENSPGPLPEFPHEATSSPSDRKAMNLAIANNHRRRTGLPFGATASRVWIVKRRATVRSYGLETARRIGLVQSAPVSDRCPLVPMTASSLPSSVKLSDRLIPIIDAIHKPIGCNRDAMRSREIFDLPMHTGIRLRMNRPEQSDNHE